MEPTLPRGDVRAFYDRFGAKQDAQRFYEDAALGDLSAHAAFESAESVYEFGCGTGRIAAELLGYRLPQRATYTGVDISTTMLALARGRIAPFGARAAVRQIDGSDPFAICPAGVDRILCTYVLDLLPEEEIASFIANAALHLNHGGKLAVVSLTFGNTLFSRTVSAGWRALFRIAPSVVGGCRPLRLQRFLAEWRIEHQAVISSWGIASEVIVASPAAAAR
ncbi:MAG TPA: class I SAM-dependent methyltransferase [Thermoanaerobaculia bacterium]|nr:class I SAM-dependent methyltransferase [Thermoanaerobaculia bacterium]